MALKLMDSAAEPETFAVVLPNEQSALDDIVAGPAGTLSVIESL